MSVRALPVVLITMIAIAPLAAADDHDHGLHGGDFALFVHDHGDGLEIEIEPRVLGAELDPGLGFAATSPGFDSAPGAFPTGSSVGIDITQALMRWTGAAFVALDSLSQETMTAAFLTLSATTGDGPVAGFAINLDGDGSWHKHLSFILNGADGADPADGIYRAEQVDRLQWAIGHLPEAEREVILLRHFSQLSFRQIAEVMETPLGTALARAHRGLARLRELMDDEQRS